MDQATLSTLFIIIGALAAASFVIGLHFMNSPATARNGNLISASGMAVAIVATFVYLVLRECHHESCATNHTRSVSFPENARNVLPKVAWKSRAKKTGWPISSRLCATRAVVSRSSSLLISARSKPRTASVPKWSNCTPVLIAISMPRAGLTNATKNWLG